MARINGFQPKLWDLVEAQNVNSWHLNRSMNDTNTLVAKVASFICYFKMLSFISSVIAEFVNNIFY